jgi:hypothetical protein
VTSQAAFGPPFFPASFLVLVATVAGCATERAYDGPPLPAGERAIVRADPVVNAGLPVQLRIRRVDGREIGLSASKAATRCSSTAALPRAIRCAASPSRPISSPAAATVWRPRRRRETVKRSG